MAMILLAVEDAGRDSAVRDLLTAEGWWVTTVGSQEEALRAAADHAPQLLVVDSRLGQAASLVRAFARREGGPGVLLLVDEPAAAADPALQGQDGYVVRSQPPSEVLARVRRCLETQRGVDAAPRLEAEADTARQFTATDLFGDILEHLGEVGAGDRRAVLEPVDDGVSGAAESALTVERVPSPVEDSAPSDEPAIETEPEVEAGADVPAGGDVASGLEAIFEAAPDAGDEDETQPEPEVEARPAVESQARVDAEIETPAGVEPQVEAVAAPLDQEEFEADAEADTEVEAGADAEVEIEADPEAEVAQLAGEVADLLEVADAADSDGLAGDVLAGDAAEPDPDGLSIHDVLAAAEPEEEPDDLQWFDELAGAEADGAGGTAAPEAEAEEEPEPVAGEPAAADLPPAPVAHDAIGPYRLLELLEFGDLTERWLATRAGGDERVVVERIRHELRERADVRQAFVDGHSEAAGWEHENILRVLDLGRDGEVDYVVTEHCPGHSLREVLERVRRMGARMPLGICLVLVERLASALQAIGDGPAASRHGWVVPGSVWLGDDGRVLLREFGCGRLGPVEEAPVRDWRDYRFLAPDLWTGRPDIRSDLYSLGALLYEMVSTHPVHDGEDLEALKLAVTTEDATPVQRVDPTVPSEVDAWIMRLLRRNVEDRPPAVMEIQSKVDLALQALPARPGDAEIAAYLRQLFTARLPEVPDDGEVEAVAEARVDSGDEDGAVDPVGRRGRWWWLLAAAVVLALVVYLLWGPRRGGGEAAPAAVPALPADAATTEEPAPDGGVAPPETPDAEPPAAQTSPPAQTPPPTQTAPARAQAPARAAAPAQDLDVAGLVAEEFARRQRDLEERLRALEEAQAAADEAAPVDPPAADAEDGEPPAESDDGGDPPAALH